MVPDLSRGLFRLGGLVRRPNDLNYLLLMWKSNNSSSSLSRARRSALDEPGKPREEPLFSCLFAFGYDPKFMVIGQNLGRAVNQSLLDLGTACLLQTRFSSTSSYSILLRVVNKTPR